VLRVLVLAHFAMAAAGRSACERSRILTHSGHTALKTVSRTKILYYFKDILKGERSYFRFFLVRRNPRRHLR